MRDRSLFTEGGGPLYLAGGALFFELHFGGCPKRENPSANKMFIIYAYESPRSFAHYLSQSGMEK